MGNVFLHADRRDRPAAGSRIQHVDRSGGLELSAGQRQLWFRYRLEPASHEYLMSRAWRIKGQLSVAALERASKDVVARHEILRTRYQMAGDEPVQVIDPIGTRPMLTVTDLTGTEDPARRARAIMDRTATLPIDLATRWPMRLRLLRLADDDHMLIVVCHHIACDAWSMEVFATELSALYGMAVGGKRWPLAPLPIQYADYAAWERSQEAEHARHLAYWERRLAGLPTLELPLGRRCSSTRGSAGDSYGFTFPWSLATGVRQLARRYGSTPYPVLLTAFQVLVSRYTGSTDIPVGTEVSARGLAELKGLIGHGANTLIMRGRWEGDPTFGELIEEAKATIAAAFDHQNVPFPKLVARLDRLEPNRDRSRGPLLPVAFALRSRGHDVLTLPGLDVTSVAMPSLVARFDLRLLIDVADNGALCGNLEYATARFDRATAARLATNYLRLLEQVVVEPERGLSEYEVISAAERAALLSGWNRVPGLGSQGGESERRVGPFELISREDRARVGAGVVDAYPMSQVQVDLVAEMTASAGRCHSCTSYRVKGEFPFSLEALRRAARLLVERHEILRTGFDLTRFSVPMQLVYAVAEIEVTEYDATAVGEAGVRPLLGEFGAAERAKPFRDPRKPCLLRLAAHVTDDQVWWLSITEHPAILEDWSQHSLLMELLACYRAWRADEVPELPEPPRLRYADFIAAEQRALASTDTRGYWQSVITEYPKFRIKRGLGESEGASRSRHVSVTAFADLDEGLRALAAAAGTPRETVLLAAHLKVLSELTDQPGFHTGVVVPGRQRVLGMYLNRLPFGYTPGAVTWIDLVRRVFEREVELLPHRNLPMPVIQRELGDGSRLLDTIFRYLDFRQVDFQVVDHTGGIADSSNQFKLSVHAQPGGLLIAADTAVLSRINTDRLATRYRTVLEAMAADPGGSTR